MRRHEELESIIQPVVDGLDCVLVGIELGSSNDTVMVRIFVDKVEGGLSADDCGILSKQINAVLSVDWKSENEYALEVSSPGIDRKLFTYEQFIPQIGKDIKLRLSTPEVDGRRNFTGKLNEVREGIISLVVDNEEYSFDYINIDTANVVPKW